MRKATEKGNISPGVRKDRKGNIPFGSAGRAGNQQRERTVKMLNAIEKVEELARQLELAEIINLAEEIYRNNGNLKELLIELNKRRK